MSIKKTKYLQYVNSPEDLKRLTIDELPLYCGELREFIIAEVSTNPGHLGSSLGALEIAVALHYVYDTPFDRLVWDVGHQAYAHKIITGRRDMFHTNRCHGGISGFPRRSESEYDCFGAGHASTSISSALGMAAAADLRGEKRKVVAIIGDGALSGGLAFEGLNNASNSNHDILVILNDNNISIDPNVGALKDYLLSLTTSKRYNAIKDRTWHVLGRVPRLRRVLQKIEHGAKSFFLHQSNMFESLNFRYFGPIDGNDIKALVRRLQDLKSIKGPKLLHALTVKGKGYPAAERFQTEWHAPGRFDVQTARKDAPATPEKLRYQDVFGYTIVELAEANDKIVGITPAMPTGCSLCVMMEKMPDRAFDVGIAEGHAVTFAAGLSSEGMIPFCNIYSSFAQRAVDNIIHDVALQGLDVVLCLDRAGLVGEDGATHHGVFDVALLRSVPGIVIAAPSSAEDLRCMMYTASCGGCGCFVIRYPRGGAFDRSILDEPFSEIAIGRSRMVSDGTGAAILSLGSTFGIAAKAATMTGAAHYDLRFAKPLDEDMLVDVAARFSRVVVVEDGVMSGGVGSAVLEFFCARGITTEVRLVGIPDRFVEHGAVGELREEVGLTAAAIAAACK